MCEIILVHGIQGSIIYISNGLERTKCPSVKDLINTALLFYRGHIRWLRKQKSSQCADVRWCPTPLGEKDEIQTFLTCYLFTWKGGGECRFVSCLHTNFGKICGKLTVITGIVEWIWEVGDNFSFYASGGDCSFSNRILKFYTVTCSLSYRLSFPDFLAARCGQYQEQAKHCDQKWRVQILRFLFLLVDYI